MSKEDREMKVHLGKGEFANYQGLRIGYRGQATTYFPPPNQERSTTTWLFEVTKVGGEIKELQYAEGFPGSLTGKPSVKAGYRSFVQLDWSASSEAEIDLILRAEERGPSAGELISIGYDHVYEFPTLSVEVKEKEARPAWTAKQIAEQTKGLSADVAEVSQKAYAEAKVTTLEVRVVDRKGKRSSYLVDDNYLWQGQPYDVSKGASATPIFLHFSSSIETPRALMLQLGP